MLAHRGLAVSAPENTLLAFQHALEAGADHIETDVHASSDRHAIVAHDDDLSRVGGVDVRVDGLSMTELARLDLGAGQHVPTLAEALDAFPDAFFNIDLKSPASIEPAVAAIRATSAEERVLVTSFSERRRAAALRLLPTVATSASGPRFAMALAATVLRATPLVRRALRGLHAVQIPERALGLTTVTPARIAAFHAAGVEVHVWTVNEPSDMERLLDLGVDGIVTDRADLALAVVASRA